MKYPDILEVGSLHPIIWDLYSGKNQLAILTVLFQLPKSIKKVGFC
jgi:hypothetical protein